MVLFVLSLGVFLTLGGMAVDLAHLYTWQTRIERAAKAAAFSTIQYRAIEGWGKFFETSGGGCAPKANGLLLLQAHATAVIRENLGTFHPDARANNDGNLTPLGANFYDCARDRVRIETTYRVPTFVLGRVARLIGSNFTDNTFRAPVRSTATAQLDPVAVALVLDVSGSMNCTDPTCACRTDGSNCNSGDKLITKLVSALGVFKGYFNPLHDYISVTTFNLGARTVFPFTAGGAAPSPFGSSTTRYADFTRVTSTGAAADSLRPLSNTNICEGLQFAITELNSFKNAASGAAGAQYNRVKKIVVLFTDGAPNAFRGTFANRTPANSSGDYQYTLEWRAATGTMYRGPSPLVNQGSLFNHVITLTSISPGNAGLCGPLVSDPAQFPHAINQNATSSPIPATRGCLTSLDFTLPGTTSASVKGVPIDSTGAIPENFNYAKLAYYCAIEASDYIRATFNATVYTVGVGFNSTKSGCADPFENIDNPVVRKDRFLHRVAMDPDAVSTTSGTLNPNYDFSRSGNTNLSLNSADCGCSSSCTTNVSSNCYSCTQSVGYTPGTGPNVNSTDQGEYFGTSSGAQLGALFSMVAKQILLRLGS
jgi:Flp pilus assembly protein TadG